MIEFFDSSALTKRYLQEPGSDAVRRATRSGPVAVSRLAYAEVAATIARTARSAAIDAGARDRALDRLEDDMSRWTVVEPRLRIVLRVRSLVYRHPLRGYDAMQLASALHIHDHGAAVRVWCTDAVLAAAASAEGLAVVRPS